MRKILTLLVLFSWCGFGLCGDPLKATFNVVIEGRTAEGEFNAWGTGTVIAVKDGESLIMTNRHVLEDATKVWIIKDGKLISGSSVFVNDKNSSYDLACLKVPLKLESLDLAKNDPLLDESVRHFGRASGPQKGKVLKITVLMRLSGEIFEDRMYTDMLSISGDSGAAIINDKDEICGINWGRSGNIDDGEQIGIPVSGIKPILKKYVANWGF